MGRKISGLINKFKLVGINFFTKNFAFDAGVDITNDIDVLYRKNIVIKNIIGLSNILYTLIFLGLSIYRRSDADWLMTVVFFPLTFAINSILKKLIHIDKNDKTKLEVAMYISAFYMFLSAILVYIRLVSGPAIYSGGTYIRLFEAASYILIFYSLVVISLYQNKKLLRNSFLSLLGIITIIHFTVTYSAMGLGLNFFDFLAEFATTPMFGDIALRTVIFILFYLVVYIIVSISEQLSNQRKEELIKRRQVQNEFAHIVRNLFTVVFSTSSDLLDQNKANQVKKLSLNLANHYHLSDDLTNQIDSYSTIHLKYFEISGSLVNESDFEDVGYEVLKERTRLGAMIAKRLQLTQKSADVVRSIYEQTNTDEFVNSMNQIQPEITSQIILLSDCYITMRSRNSFKRAISHEDTVKYFSEHFTPFFDYKVKETFLKYNEEFERLYNSFF